MKENGRLEIGDRVTRLCARPGSHRMVLRTGTVIHTGRMNVQVVWDNGARQKYNQSELTYVSKRRKP